MNTLLGDEQASPEALEQMRKQVGTESAWYAYQNHDLGHPDIGGLQFLHCGGFCTYANPPEKMPDSHLGIGWRYLLVGKVNLETGEIEEI